MHPSIHAKVNPDKAAVIVAETGEIRTFAQLDDASNRAAQFFRSRGLLEGDVVALMLDNTPDYFDFTWGAQRAGLHYVCISSRLTADETDYVIEDSGAKMIIVSASLASVAENLSTGIERYALGGAIPGCGVWEEEVAPMSSAPIADERAGVAMLYSSGTTGRPKGIRVKLPEDRSIAQSDVMIPLMEKLYRINSDSVYLCPAPLYHAAPLGWTMRIHKFGGTVVLMKKFDPEGALAAIERYGVTCGQFVPTHFVRMLKLPDKVRARYDLSTLDCAVHAAAPCPIPVKEAMIAWWGPVIEEYYSGSEGVGTTHISTKHWLTHKGSVGRAVHGELHICDENGDPLPARIEGAVFFDSPNKFEYHGDPEKTASSHNKHGWATLGDVGWVDEDGFLYLTDRKSFMIISGGVNIYPQEIENHLVTHPKVQDVAVIGGPHDEMGEEVIAVVQPVNMADANDDFRAELTTYAREKLSGVKVPRRIDFLDALPRHETGKLFKRLLRDQYWAKTKD